MADALYSSHDKVRTLGNLKEPKFDRVRFERMAAKHLESCDEPGFKVRADALDMWFVSDDRVFIRHTVNCGTRDLAV